ncbi:MAG: S41 family peptidase [Burkholderiales bacterium]|nr:S41 family peptidase [Burkholderiales bacterium]
MDGFGGVEREGVDAFAQRLAQEVDDAVDNGAAGWIVDLRRNGGGNMWPMLGGLAGLLGTGAIGSFVDAAGASHPWRLAERVTVPAVRHRSDASPVAVLVGGDTASSGEAVAVAFVARPFTRLFGVPTKGLTSGNEAIELADGAIIFLTTVLFADRSGRRFGGPVIPDETVPEDKARDVARAWVRGCLAPR